MSLFGINGILSWQLTPAGWHTTHDVWQGMFNPSFLPSLIFRTISSLAEAVLFACLIINFVPHWTREQTASMFIQAVRFLVPMTVMLVVGVWYFGVVPADSREWVFGESAAMNMFLMVCVGASLQVGIYAAVVLVNQRMFLNGTTELLLIVLALAATAGGEFVREGIRKPYTVRNMLYSNSVTETEAAELREKGSVASDPYPLRDEASPPRRIGSITTVNSCRDFSSGMSGRFRYLLSRWPGNFISAAKHPPRSRTWSTNPETSKSNTSRIALLQSLAIVGLGASVVAGGAYYLFLETTIRLHLLGWAASLYLLAVIVGIAVRIDCWRRSLGGGKMSRLRLLTTSGDVVTAAGGATALRELRRAASINLLDQAGIHEAAAKIGGLGVFLGVFVVNFSAIALVVRAVHRGLHVNSPR